ncbi:MAG: DUF4268 domain-containing protein [Chloroflexota bacterium]
MIGKIQRVLLRDIWPHEARDLTPWLQENLDVINEVTGLTLVGAEREQAAGSFSVDLVAEDELNRTIIIENQLEKSDHDHLGKLLTYLVAFDAAAAIWITPHPRPEHVNVINWLNESATADFYLLKLEAIRINNSAPAPLVTSIVGPSIEARQVGETKKELAERHHIRRAFWSELLQRANAITSLHSNISAGIAPWVGTGAGKSGLAFNYVIRQQDARVELEVATGDDVLNRHYFQQLLSNRTAIEGDFGASLIWDQVESRSACYIRCLLKQGGYRHEAKWNAIQDKMISSMVRLEKTLRPYLRQL